MKNRVHYLDTARALCMLWIIGVWHIGAYSSSSFVKSNIYTNPITVGVLATFTFISGKFLGATILNIKEVAGFYLRRLRRVYPLFLISCISLYLLPIIFDGARVYISDINQLCLTITGLACFVSPMPATIWYFCMILLFYLITPIITICKNLSGRVISSILLYVVLLFTYIYGETEERVILYFPIYCLGLLCYNRENLWVEKFRYKGFVVGVVGVVVSSWLIVRVGENPFANLLPALTWGIVIIELSKLLTTYNSGILETIAYTSMCGYLFHRQYFEIIYVTFGRVQLFIADCIMLPLFLIGCLGIQKVYDNILIYLTKRKETN